MLIDRLPAFPDNLHHVPTTNTFWVGLVARPSKLMQSPVYRPMSVRGLAARLPGSLISRFAGNVGGGIEFDASGKVLQVIADPGGQVVKSTPSGLLLKDMNMLVMGNLHHRHLSVTLLRHQKTMTHPA